MRCLDAHISAVRQLIITCNGCMYVHVPYKVPQVSQRLSWLYNERIVVGCALHIDNSKGTRLVSL